MTMVLLSIDELKSQARRLRDAMSAKGAPLTHSEALELTAKSHGMRDWNTLAALAGRSDNHDGAPATVGAIVSGRYLGQAFRGEVIALQRLSQSKLYSITLHFEQPVDVVTFDSFSAFRRRVTGVVDGNGISPKRTSNGQPHIVLYR